MRLKRITGCLLAGLIMVSTALTGCGSIDAGAVGATLDDQEISLGFMNFMAKYQQAMYDINYSPYFGTEMWSTEIGADEDGNVLTMTESVKKSVSGSIETLYLLEKHMGDYGVTVTEEEMARMQEVAAEFISANSSKAVKLLGATEEYVVEMLRLYTIQKKMQDAIYAEVDTNVTDEEAAQRTFTYIRASVAKGKDADGKSVDYDDDQKAEFETTMKGIADKAKTDFDGAKELDENLYSTTYSYGGDDSTMDEAVIAAADALKEGEVSDLITTEEYYYVIRLDSEFDQEATDKKKTDIASQRQADHYTEVCDGYKEASQFAVKEEAWAQVVFNRLFTAEADETEE
ncbi:MAG: peptidyl-prolyl cis-trans isomerase [Lachnospiraceae bacterium]|jgi:foldase protein PrsA|nr:peptidyl-prolyl cis-trans isomerase [Lachnospiraceae bacterium]MCI9150395.1 peptidyl-prolyl cis-trans isomerase [Lachnospiraceae bacterium]